MSVDPYCLGLKGKQKRGGPSSAGAFAPGSPVPFQPFQLTINHVQPPMNKQDFSIYAYTRAHRSSVYP